MIKLDLAFGLIELSLIGPGIDLKQQVAFLDFRAFSEWASHEIAGDARDDVHSFDGAGSAREIQEIGDVALDRLADREENDRSAIIRRIVVAALRDAPKMETAQ